MKNNVKYLMIAFCLIVTLSQSFSQVNTDSLIISLKAEANDTVKLTLLDSIAMELRKTDLPSAMDYANQQVDLAIEMDYPNGIANAYLTLAIIHRYTGSYLIAHDYCIKADSIYKIIDDKSGIASAYNFLGTIFNRLNILDKALEYYNESLSLYTELNDSNNIASIIANLGTVYERKQEIDSALRFYQLSLDLYKATNQDDKISNAYLNIGSIYEKRDSLETAKELYIKSYRISRRKGGRDLAYSCEHLGGLYSNMDQFDSAIIYLTNSINIAREMELRETIIAASKAISSSYENIGKYDSAIYYLKLAQLEEKLLQDEQLANEIQIREQKAEYESLTRAQEERYRKTKLRNILYIIGLGLTAIFSILIFRNFRMKQKANRLLAEMDEMKSRLFSNISHEFRTPLTLILGPLEEMMELEKEKKPSKKTVQMMQRNANRLLDLVNQMLDLSKVDAGSMKLELVEEDIVKAIRVSILSFASLAEKKNIKFSHTLPGKKLVTWFDPDKLEKILNNLVSNAFKFTPEGGTVNVEARLEQQGERTAHPVRLLITVEDTGKGIPEDQLDKIFDRFHQVEEAKEFETMGTGIGLALTRELVEVMHGKISVESQVGKGTKFSLEIPFGKDHLKEQEYTILESIETSGERKMREDEMPVEEEYPEETQSAEESSMRQPIVLTVEDHEEIRTHIREHLEDYFKVLEAEHGRTGLEIAIENVPDLIITDLMMPEMDGVELCKRLKTDERTSHIPVIMLTAKASIEDRLEGLETGADAYLTKPFNIKELRLRVAKLIEQRKRLRERFRTEISLEPKDIAVTSADERFLQKAMVCVEEHMGDSDFDVGHFQEEMLMSRMQLFRKLKALTNHTPSEFIRNLRLKRAARLIDQKFGNVAEVCYEVGFNNLSYFAKCFKELFGVLPSEYQRQEQSKM